MIDAICECCSAAFRSYPSDRKRYCSVACYRVVQRVMSKDSLPSRLLGNIEVGDPAKCWPWRGKRTPDGYGVVKVEGREDYAHRMVCELASGPLGDRQALHRCDNPPCCNPAHIYPGTPADNIKDMDARGRRGRSYKLSVETVQQIAASKFSWRKTAAAFGVSKRTVMQIKMGRHTLLQPQHCAPLERAQSEAPAGR